MKVVFFSAKPYDKKFFEESNTKYGYDFEFYETHLGPHIVNAIEKADVVCVFVNDKLSAEVLEVLAAKGVRIIALRCAGFNNIDLNAAKKLGLRVCRVPAYSPEAVAEHAVALLLTLNRKTHKAYNRVREQNFSLQGLLGFNLHGKTVGVIGTGKTGKAFCHIMKGFGCKIIAFDPVTDADLSTEGVQYMQMEDVFREADIISLHCPLTDSNRHLMNKSTIALCKKGIVLINTSRGGLINTVDIIDALKNRQVSLLGIDVYEQEEKLFFRDLSGDIIEDDLIQRLMSFPNVLITAHQAFFTNEALFQIAEVTLASIKELSNSLEPMAPGVMLA